MLGGVLGGLGVCRLRGLWFLKGFAGIETGLQGFLGFTVFYRGSWLLANGA